MTLIVSPLMRRLSLSSAALMVFLLFYLGAKPVAVNLFPEPWDKLAHITAFGAIAGFVSVGLVRRRPLWVIALVTLIGAVDEWHQVYLPGRSADVMDLVADFIGAILVVTVVEWLRLNGVIETPVPATDP